MLYAASALAAFAIAPDVGGALDVIWARVAVLAYAVGALVAWLLVSRRVSIRRERSSHRRCPPQPLVTIATTRRRSSGVPNIRLVFVAG